MKKLLLVLSLTIVPMIITIAQTVHYTFSGSKYHSEGCESLSRSDYKCSLQEALKKGLTPCFICKPPKQVIVKKAKTKKQKKITKTVNK